MNATQVPCRPRDGFGTSRKAQTKGARRTDGASPNRCFNGLATICFLLLALSAPSSLAAVTNDGFTNPIIPGFHPDPSVCRRGDEFFLVNSSFEYFPGIPLFRSKDLIHWEQIGHVLTRRSQLDLTNAATSAGIYAPTLRCENDSMYVITNNTVTHEMFFVHTKDPQGEWSDPVVVKPFLGDPSLMFDDTGKVYVTGIGRDPVTKEEGISQYEVDIAKGQALSPPKFLWKGTGGKYPEGPHLYKIKGKYYLMIAEGGSEGGHMVTVARSQTPWGPFVPNPSNPILTNRNTRHIDESVQGTGHGDLVQAKDGSWWMVFLGYRIFEGMHVHTLGRETYLAPVSWDKKGWPVVYGGKPIEANMKSATLPSSPVPLPPARDDFSSSSLAPEWNFLRNPDSKDWSLVERPGWLRLQGNANTLLEKASPAWVGRRLDQFRVQASTLLDFTPASATEVAGLTVFMNRKNHHDIVVKGVGSEREVQLHFTLGEIHDLHARENIGPGPVRLRFQSDLNFYYFSYSVGDGAWKSLGKVEAKYLATEIASGFTGVYLAMFATGNGKPSRSPAYFDWFEYVTAQKN